MDPRLDIPKPGLRLHPRFIAVHQIDVLHHKIAEVLQLSPQCCSTFFLVRLVSFGCRLQELEVFVDRIHEKLDVGRSGGLDGMIATITAAGLSFD